MINNEEFIGKMQMVYFGEKNALEGMYASIFKIKFNKK